MSKGKICIIDDEPDMGDTCRDILLAQGYDVDITSDAVEGLAKITVNTYDVVLVDLMMPKHDGLFILSEIQKLNRNTCVIMFTGYPTIESAVSAMRLGAFDYLVKPFMATQLITVINKAFASKNLQN